MKTCNRCISWTPYNEFRTYSICRENDPVRFGGICTSDSLGEPGDPKAYNKDSLTYSYDEEGYFWTGPAFGCIHWKEKQ